MKIKKLFPNEIAALMEYHSAYLERTHTIEANILAARAISDLLPHLVKAAQEAGYITADFAKRGKKK